MKKYRPLMVSSIVAVVLVTFIGLLLVRRASSPSALPDLIPHSVPSGDTPPTFVSTTPAAWPTASSPQGTGQPTPGIDPEPSLEGFVEACGAKVARRGQIAYPGTLEVRLNDSTTYGAAVDERDNPPSPGVEIPGDDPRSEPIKVECVIGARLVPVTGGIKVDESDADTDGGWWYQQFPPSGVVEWSWSVTPTESRRQELRLDLRPAAREIGTSNRLPADSRASFSTTVKVKSSWIERLGGWFQTQWPQLATVAGILGGAFLAILAFSKEVRQRIADLRRNKRPEQAPGDKPGDDPEA